MRWAHISIHAPFAVSHRGIPARRCFSKSASTWACASGWKSSPMAGLMPPQKRIQGGTFVPWRFLTARVRPIEWVLCLATLRTKVSG